MNRPDRAEPLNRRHFLQGLAGLGGAFFLAGCARGAMDVDDAPAASTVLQPSNIGVQLYTVRDQLLHDFEGTIERVAEIGYNKLEFAGYYDRSPAQVRQLLDRLDVTAPSAHIGLELLRDDLEAEIEAAQTVGHEYITIPALPGAWGDGISADAWTGFAEEFNRIGAACRDAGLNLAYHNHAFEFAAAGNGMTGMDVLLTQTDPDLVDFELDLMWTVVAAVDPIALIERYPGRFTMWHVKDLKGADRVQAANRAGNQWNRGQHIAAVGEGEIDFARIFEYAGESGLEYFFVENDEPSDSLANIQRSHAYLTRLLG